MKLVGGSSTSTLDRLVAAARIEVLPTLSIDPEVGARR